jgi:hypothetical protein
MDMPIKSCGRGVRRMEDSSMIQLGKNKSARQAIAARTKFFAGFPANHALKFSVHCFSNLRLALHPAAAYIPHSFYNE